MTYILNYSSVVLTRYRIQSKFGGSSKYRVLNNELSKKPSKRTKPFSPNIGIDSINEIPKDLQADCEMGSEKGVKIYKLNKSKVRKKCHALSRLRKSKKFLAFYTITFPVNLSDQICYKLFNTWLTRCRKTGGLNTYLWVAERQKNGTIHFHMLTNDFMPIKTVNGYMGKALETEHKKGTEALKTLNADSYNGIDVKKVGNKRNSLISYLVKYISKNNIEFYRLPWHCSRDVSRLFTSIYFDVPDDDPYFEKLPRVTLDNITDKYNVEKTEKYNVAGFKFLPDQDLFKELDRTNEVLYYQ
jgi:hypothetical protein